MTDPIADMIIRIKNATLVSHETVSIPHSKIKENIARLLLENNYIDGYEVVEKKPQSDIVVKLKYKNKLSAITDVKRASKPGRRLYSDAKSIPQTLGGYGITIVTTSKGLMTQKEARKQNLGGELLCQIW